VLTFIADIARVPTTSQIRAPSLNLERYLAAPAERWDLHGHLELGQ